MTSDEWLLLGIVTINDYYLHFQGNGIITNKEMICDPRAWHRATGDISAKVQMYVREVTGVLAPSTSGQAAGPSGQYVWNFTDAVKVFATDRESGEQPSSWRQALITLQFLSASNPSWIKSGKSSTAGSRS
ncbi:hypothetical protein BGZ68_001176 [Mortierella alpina]|nr:hypothetical protein BGZ68_001176 [Mortierella alpina]